MKILILKMRLFVLWIFTAVSITAEFALYLYEKGYIGKVMSGEVAGNLVLWTCRCLSLLYGTFFRLVARVSLVSGQLDF